MRFLIIIMQQSCHLRPIKDGRVFIQLVRRELGQPGYRYYVLLQNASKPISFADGECRVELDTSFYPIFPRGGEYVPVGECFFLQEHFRYDSRADLNKSSPARGVKELAKILIDGLSNVSLSETPDSHKIVFDTHRPEDISPGVRRVSPERAKKWFAEMRAAVSMR